MGSPVQAVRWRRQDRLRHWSQQPVRQTAMNSKLVTSAATLLLLLCLVETGSGIKCHQCNSYDEYHCGDPFYYADTPDQPKTDKFLKDCPNDGKDYFCRKIFQNEKDRECYTTVLEEYNTEVCSCSEDGCNSASMSQLSAAVMSAVSLAYLLH